LLQQNPAALHFLSQSAAHSFSCGEGMTFLLVPSRWTSMLVMLESLCGMTGSLSISAAGLRC
jgi:hypothetical protein